MKKAVNILLMIAIVVPIAIWPWTVSSWNFIRNLILHAIPALAAQALFCRIGKHSAIKAIPALLTGVKAASIVCLYLSTPHYWDNAMYLEGLFANHLAPFLCCLLVIAGFWIAKKRQIAS